MEIKVESLLNVIEGIKHSVLKTSNKELYIPLHGKYTTNLEEEPFDLAEKINSFFVFNDTSNYDPKVMLLMGDTGSGKSMFSQQVHQQLWEHCKAGDPIPLCIPLPELQNPFEGAVEEVLTKYGFNDSQISEMKGKEKFIFIVDGYDELHQFQNCYVTNKWHQWNAKVLITCRSQALYYQKDPDKYFVPFNGEKRLPQLLRRLYVAPFSKDQISAYVKKYQQLNTENKISEEDFAKVPGLTELIKTPFLLHLAVEALPTILADQAADEENQKMTQAKLYDVFIEQWFARQIAKLPETDHVKDTDQNMKQRFWGYCKNLAQKMYEKEVIVIPYQGQKVGGRLFGKQEQTNSWVLFFSEETEIVRSACPLRRYGDHHYGFVHASMVEYFATRSMYEEILEDEIAAHNSVIASEVRQSNKMLSSPGSLRVARDDEDKMLRNDADGLLRFARDDGQGKDNQFRAGIHQRLFSLERQSIQFLADRIEMSEVFKKKMLVILESSKKSELYAIGAANTITALVRAGVTFNGANLSGIRIPGADISGGFFNSADLSGADLSHTQMKSICFREASIKGSQFMGVNFGEYPRFMQDRPVRCFDFREDLSLFAVLQRNTIKLCDTVTGDQLKLLSGHEGYVESVKFSPDGKWLVSSSYDKTIQIWEVSSGSEMTVLQGHEMLVNSVAFSPDGKQVVSGSDDKTVRVWDIANNVAIAVLDHKWRVTCVAFSPDGQQVVSGSYKSKIRVWDINLSKVLKVLQLLEGDYDVGRYINCIAYSSNGKYIATAIGFFGVQIWEVFSGKLIARLCGHTSTVNSVAFSSQGERVISGSSDATVRIWEIQTQKEVACLRGHADGVNCVQFTADGKRVISGSDDASIRVWDTPEEPAIARSRIDYLCRCLQLSPNGQWVVLGNEDSTVRICETQNWKERVVLKGHKGVVTCVQFSPDGKQLVSGSSDHWLRFWDVESGEEILFIYLTMHEDAVRCVQYDLNGQRVVSGSRDKTIRIWEVSCGADIAVLYGHQDEVCSVAFSQDGKRILSGSADKTVRLWEVSTREQLKLLSFQNYLYQVNFCPNEEEFLVYEGSDITIVNVKSEKMRVNYTGTIKICGKIQFIGDGQRVIAIGPSDTVVILDIMDIHYWQSLHSQKFTTAIINYSYHNNGSLVIVFGDGSIECWQMIGDRDNYGWKFHWTTNIYSPTLFVEGLLISDVMGMSDQNCRLLEQCGASAKPRSVEDAINLSAERQELESHQLISEIPSLTDSSIRQKPTFPPCPLKRVETALAENQELREPSRQETVQEQHQGDEVPRSSLAKTKWRLAKRTGSPIHQNNDKETKSDDTEDEEKARHDCIKDNKLL